MDWSPQQDAALAKVRRWLDGGTDEKQVFRLFGYAGTGKTTLAIDVARMVGGGGDVLFAAFTGKAALVMRGKGCLGASTIHSLIYKRRRDKPPKTGGDEGDLGELQWLINPEGPVAYARLVIIDECSMVDERLGQDLLSFNVPVLVLGDPAQLPPVAGAGFFMGEPDVMLTEVHRQAAGNPIVQVATDVRMGKPLVPGSYKGDHDKVRVAILPWARVKTATKLAAGQIICGGNRTRAAINVAMRAALRAEGRLPAGGVEPVVGDRVICLKNKRDRGLLNGAMFRVTELLDRMPGAARPGNRDTSYLLLDSLDREHMRDVGARVPKVYWPWDGRGKIDVPKGVARDWDEFAYAYAITCHKSQGSQWDNVLVYDESELFNRDGAEDIPRRWLYTALTRAAERLVIGV